MINIEQITSRLAKLPDQQLQQYAMMHKSDPYIMALALSESKRRKQLRASAQAGPAQEQPKVVDTALAEMSPQQSPDDAGIAALPAGEMDFADGGIVAFAGGGGTYETPYDRMNRENREAAAKPPESELESLIAARARYVQAGSDTSGIDQAIATLQAKTELPQANYSNEGLGLLATPYSNEGRRASMAGVTPSTLPPPAPKPKAEAGLGGTPEAAAVRGTPSVGASGVGAPSVAGAKDKAGQFLDTKSLRGDLDKFYKDEETAVAESRKRRDEGKPEGTAYSEYEKQLQSEAAGADKEKGEAQGVAIFKAGLAMMAGASPNAFENIGKGAMAGLEEYSGAMKDMKKAAKERQKALADIENARRAESRDDWKAAQAFEEKAGTRMSKAREVGIKGIMDITGKDAEIAASIYKTQVTEQGATQRTSMQVEAMRERNAGGTGDKQQLAELKALQSSLAAQLKTEFNKDQRTAINMQLARVNAEIAKMAGLGTMTAAPGAASPGGTSNAGWGKAQVVNP